MTFRTSEASAQHVRELTERTGALVVGRRLFDRSASTAAPSPPRSWRPACSTRSTSIFVPVLLGDGIPLFANLRIAPVQLEGPTRVVQGTEVTHLAYRVRREG